MKKIILLLAAVSCSFWSCKKNQPNFVTHVFPKQQWIGGLIGIFSGMKLHLNNYTSAAHQYEQDDNYAYEDPKSSSLLIPSLSNVPWAFDVPVTRQDPYSIYIDDVNSTRLAADAHDGEAFITINFESDGTEIIGDCVNNVSCICGSPRMDLTNIITLVPLTFAPASDGSASVSAGDVSFTSDISETGPCVNNACAFLCGILAPNRQSDMQKAIQKFIEDFVDQNSALISSPFTQYLKTLGVSGPIVAIQIKTNGDLSVEDKE